jgi:uncharacterized membrane-anchored protein YhcB (DUF1043 family)
MKTGQMEFFSTIFALLNTPHMGTFMLSLSNVVLLLIIGFLMSLYNRSQKTLNTERQQFSETRDRFDDKLLEIAHAFVNQSADLDGSLKAIAIVLKRMRDKDNGGPSTQEW